MTPRGLLPCMLLVWAVLLAGGVLLHGRLHADGDSNSEVRAARALRANHRITDADLAVNVSLRVKRDLPAVRDLLGRYLLAAKRQDEAIARRDVAEQPSLLTSGGGRAAIVYQMPERHRALAELLDVGAQVRLCAPPPAPSAPPCHPDAAEVLAVHPAGPSGADAWLLLALPASAEAGVHPYLTAEGRYPLVL